MCDVGALELQTGECKGPADRQLIDTTAFEAEVRKCEGRIEPLCLMGFGATRGFSELVALE